MYNSESLTDIVLFNYFTRKTLLHAVLIQIVIRKVGKKNNNIQTKTSLAVVQIHSFPSFDYKFR